MLEKLLKRGLSLLLVMVMVLSMAPAHIFAAENEDTQSVEGAQITTAPDDDVQTITETEPEETTEEETTEEETTEVPVSQEVVYPNTPDDGHTHESVVSDREPPLCQDPGMAAGTYCKLCGITLSGREELPALGHDIIQYEAKNPTYSGVGWYAYEECSRCGYTTYVEIPKLETPVIEDYDTFMMYLMILEDIANAYVLENPGKDPVALVIKYIRTGVDRYNSGSWGIMAGYEDKGFADYVAMIEDMANAEAGSVEEMFAITSLKNIECFYLPNGDYVDIGHMFGTMDIIYHNNFGLNHADVGGWAGDLVNLVEFADYSGVTGTLEEQVAYIAANNLLAFPPDDIPSFSQTDMYGDLDAMYLMTKLQKEGYHYEYEVSGLFIMLMEYFTEDLTMEDRAEFFLNTRLGGVTTRGDVRDAVYTAYSTNKLVTTLEGTCDFKTNDFETLRKAACYAFADYICKLAGDYVDSGENDLYTVFSSEGANLAPGVNQKTVMATNANGQQLVFYLATADITRDDVSFYVNYNNNDPSQGWEMQRVLDQALAAEQRHSDPNSPLYIENYNVVVATNGAGFNMSTGEPSGLLIMEGVEYSPINGNGFFGILKDGTPIIASTAEYNTLYKGQVQEGIACFGKRLIEDGKICENLPDEQASRTAVGITKTGKLVLLVMDGRQAPFSAGCGEATLAQIMLEAGCVEAVNMDGGGSSTFAAQMPGDDELTVVNRPSDGFARSVSTSMIIVSTAPSSTAFDHAEVDTDKTYLTVGSSLQASAVGISPTGNTVDIPEGAYWAVSDSSVGQISEEGMFTALANGTVDVYLMLEEAVIGSKTLYVVYPDNLYFTKPNIDVVYGETADLPIKLLYQGKEVAFNINDVVLSVSNKSGTFDGLRFVANADENSGVTNGVITAKLACDPSVSASLRVALYKQGELSFDFDQATGGDRMLAWHRTVSNAQTDDNSSYIVIDPNEPMTASYILAIDMTHIPIPERLEELTYMLPGSDLEGANAWTFLCQLAERISTLTQITAKVYYDPNFELDVSEIKIINDYLTLSSIEHNEEECSLTLQLSWKKQTQAIDQASANPMCIVNGIKLTPKADAAWDANSKLVSNLEGTISYKIYMRASALYSFSQKPENQEVFGLYDYINPEDSYDKGGYFQDTYSQFQDSFTLINRIKEGWYNEEGGFTYYVEGTKVTGVYKVDDLYYNFGENGVLSAKNPYTGLLVDNGNTYYAKLGVPVTGWHNIGEDWYLLDWSTAAGKDGQYQTTIDGVTVTYLFENGKLLKGYWHKDEKGLQYFYGPYYYKQGWKTIEGEQYFFEEYYAATGIYPVRAAHAINADWCEFDENGVYLGKAPDGLYWYEGQRYYVVGALTQKNGLNLVDGEYYYTSTTGELKVNTTVWIGRTNDLLPAGTYRFDAEGKIIMTTGLVEEDGTLYYYANGKRTANAGLVAHNGYIYLVSDGAMVVRNEERWVSKTNGLKPAGTYYFDAEGKLVAQNGIHNGYYYVDGAKTAAGLIYVDGAYYYATSGGALVTDCVKLITNMNDLLPAGNYRFDAEGRIIMTTELVEENGAWYYYQDGKQVANAGLVRLGNDYYYISTGAMAITNKSYYVYKTNGLLTAGTYRFDAEGKIIFYTGLLEEEGATYYYKDGRRVANAGLIQFEGAYYHVSKDAMIQRDVTVWVSRTNGLKPEGSYSFDADGKMIIYNGIHSGYYYIDGVKTAAGLFRYEGNYYYARWGGKLVANMSFWVGANSHLPEGTYRFDSTGKIILTTEVVNENGTYYYYYNGKRVNSAGLVQVDGAYYYVVSGAIAITGKSQYVYNTNGLLPAGTYHFDDEGKMIVYTGLKEEDDGLYYYKDGKRLANAGIILHEGAYYYIGNLGKAQQNVTVWTSRTNGYWPEGSYTFGADGKMIIYDGIHDGYYYVDGIKTAAGLLLIDGDYYYAKSGGKLVVDTSFWVSATNDLLSTGVYLFDAEGKMSDYTGIRNEDGTLYYYSNGRRTANAGMVLFEGAYYYISNGGIAVVDQSMYVSKNNGLLPAGTYRFDAQGKIVMTTEVVNEDGTLYYYKDGKRTANAGVVEFEGAYYYISANAIAITNQSYYVYKTNGLVAEGTYEFDANGKMILN